MKEKKQEDLEEEIKILKKVLISCKKTLEEWDRVSIRLLYPHQHNTASLNKKTLAEIKKVICHKKN